jgi:hypothetical protein
VSAICVALGLTFSVATPARGEVQPDAALSLKAGAMNYKKSGLVAESDSTVAYALEWQHFTKRDGAVFLGYRRAAVKDGTRTLYQAGFGGFRYFPWTLGQPTKAITGGSIVDYDFRMKPYVEAGLSYGRYLIATRGEGDVIEFSSDFYGVTAGTGAVFALTSRFALELSAVFEQAQGVNSPFKFSADNLYGTLGFNYLH